MRSFLVYDKHTGSGLRSISSISDPHDAEMKDHETWTESPADPRTSYVDLVTGKIQQRPPATQEGAIWQDGQWVVSVDTAKGQAMDELRRRYRAVQDGVDPTTGKRIYVDCTVGETTYRMNAGRKAAETHDAGVRLADDNGETETFIVDFYDETHYAVPIAAARAVAKAQALDARDHYIQYQQRKQQIAAAQTVAEVRAIDLKFAVNVED